MIHCKITKIWQLIITIYNTFTKYPNKAISILFPGDCIINVYLFSHKNLCTMPAAIPKMLNFVHH